MLMLASENLPDEINLVASFQLTPAEARIALGIARGKTLANIAQLHGISVQTAKTQLKSVFSKTHTHRQAELAVLMIEGRRSFI
jgi:DNA-binding CsgD family transcriptional regulator